jgi:hypothetical protein
MLVKSAPFRNKTALFPEGGDSTAAPLATSLGELLMNDSKDSSQVFFL